MSKLTVPTHFMSAMLLSAAFAGYCCSGGDQGADANNSDPNSGATGACCTPAPPQTKVLWEGPLPANGNTPVLQVSAYREVMIAAAGCTLQGSDSARLFGKPAGGTADYKWGDAPFGTRVPVYTPEIFFTPDNCGSTAKYVVLDIN